MNPDDYEDQVEQINKTMKKIFNFIKKEKVGFEISFPALLKCSIILAQNESIPKQFVHDLADEFWGEEI